MAMAASHCSIRPCMLACVGRVDEVMGMSEAITALQTMAHGKYSYADTMDGL